MGRTRRARFGIDKPAIPSACAEFGTWLAAVGAVLSYGHLFSYAAIPYLFAAIVFTHMVWHLLANYKGKPALWRNLLDELELSGSERILDAGCGRGSVLIAAAHRVPSGKVIGIDRWLKSQTGNKASATRANTERAGVAERTEVVTGNLRALPCSEHRFDLVLCSLALSDIESTRDRKTALHELVRVLKPGGRLILTDTKHIAEYTRTLTQTGRFREPTVRRCPTLSRYGFLGRTTVLKATAAG